MSQTTETATPPKQDTNAEAQDRWVTTFTGVEARRGAIAIGEDRAPPRPTWQDATPSDPTAPKMEQPRDLKLAEIDAALLGLTQAADEIGAPLGRAGVEPDITRAKEGRDALASAADRGEIAKQLAAAPALLEGIEAARLAAVKDKADGETLAAKKLEVGNALAELGKAADEIGAPLKRAAIDPAVEELTKAHAAMGQATTREQVAEQINGAGALLGKIGEATQAARKDKADGETLAEKTRVADEALKQLNSDADGIGAPLGRTAVQGEIDKLTQALAGLGKAATREALAKEIETAEALPGQIAEAGKAIEKDKQSILALAAEKEKVRLALEAVETAAGQIGAPLLRTAIDPQINGVKQQAEALTTAATRETINQQVAAAPTLLGEIEKVRLAAVKDKDDCANLVKAQDDATKAYVLLDTAVKAITGAPAQKSVADTVKGIDIRRDALLQAGDRTEIDKQIKAAPQFLLDIASAQQAAEQAELGWQDVLAKKVKAEKTLKTVKSRLTWLPDGQNKTDLTKERDAIVETLAKLDNAATLDAAKNDVAIAGPAATTLNNKVFGFSAPEMAADRLKGLAKWLRVFDKVVKPNAVSDTYDNLKNSYDAAKSDPDPGPTYDAIDDDISEAIKHATKAYAADQSRGLFLAEAQKNVGGVTNPGLKQQIQDALKNAETDRKAAYGEATIKDMYSKLRVERDYAEMLKGAAIGIAGLTGKAQAALLEATTAIKLLTAGTPPEPDLTKQYKKIEKALADAPGIPDFRDEIDSMNDIITDALDLVEQARKAVFAEQAKTKDGTKKIDELIKNMGEGTDDPVKQAVVRAAIEARFKVPLEIPKGLSVTTLPTIYEMLAMVGENHLAGLEGLAFDTDPTTTASYYGGNKIVLNNMRDPNKEEDYQDQGDPDKQVRVKTCKTTALHELGHHVDEIKDVMGKNMEKAGFGKWKSESLDDVVTAVYTASFAALVGTGSGKTPTEQDLRALVRSLLESGKATKPTSDTDTLGSLFAEWANIEGKTGWTVCLAIRDPDGNTPWNTPVEVASGRAYHEGYDNDWYSYDVGERAAGISDYQWRSPVEWFAEQFAFYRLQPQRQKPKAIAAYLSM